MAAYLLHPLPKPLTLWMRRLKPREEKAASPGSHRGLVGSARPLSLRLVLPLPVLLEPSCVPGTVCGIQGKVGL